MREALIWGVPSLVGLVVLGLVTLNSLASPAEGVRPAVATDAPAVVATAVGSRTPR